jgi:hypothetical protein
MVTKTDTCLGRTSQINYVFLQQEFGTVLSDSPLYKVCARDAGHKAHFTQRLGAAPATRCGQRCPPPRPPPPSCSRTRRLRATNKTPPRFDCGRQGRVMTDRNRGRPRPPTDNRATSAPGRQTRCRRKRSRGLTPGRKVVASGVAEESRPLGSGRPVPSIAPNGLLTRQGLCLPSSGRTGPARHAGEVTPVLPPLGISSPLRLSKVTESVPQDAYNHVTSASAGQNRMLLPSLAIPGVLRGIFVSSKGGALRSTFPRSEMAGLR